MDREYARPLDVEALARTACMSSGHFSRSFRAAYGETPYGYLMTRRIERGLRRGLLLSRPCGAGCGAELSMAPEDSQAILEEFGRPEYDQAIADNPIEVPLSAAALVRIGGELRKSGPEAHRTELDRVPPSSSERDHRLRLLHRRDGLAPDALRPGVHRARDPADPPQPLNGSP